MTKKTKKKAKKYVHFLNQTLSANFFENTQLFFVLRKKFSSEFCLTKNFILRRTFYPNFISIIGVCLTKEYLF